MYKNLYLYLKLVQAWFGLDQVKVQPHLAMVTPTQKRRACRRLATKKRKIQAEYPELHDLCNALVEHARRMTR